jgi:hypothetical protein
VGAKECRKENNQQLSRCDDDVEGKKRADRGHLIRKKQPHQHEIEKKKS